MCVGSSQEFVAMAMVFVITGIVAPAPGPPRSCRTSVAYLHRVRLPGGSQYADSRSRRCCFHTSHEHALYDQGVVPSTRKMGTAGLAFKVRIRIAVRHRDDEREAVSKVGRLR